MAVFSVTTAITQAPIGFLVDSLRRELDSDRGIALEGARLHADRSLPELRGAGGAAIRRWSRQRRLPSADYVILNAGVAHRRMGRAFSIHTFAGYSGDAVAPVTMLFLLTMVDWADRNRDLRTARSRGGGDDGGKR